MQLPILMTKINASWVSKYSYISLRNKKSTTLNISETNKITSKNPYLVYKCLEFVWIPGSVYNDLQGYTKVTSLKSILQGKTEVWPPNCSTEEYSRCVSPYIVNSVIWIKFNHNFFNNTNGRIQDNLSWVCVSIIKNINKGTIVIKIWLK